MADKPKGRLTLGSEPRRRPDLARFAPTMHTLTGSLPVWLLVVVHVVAGPLLLFHYGSYHWFRLDDSAFLVDGSSFPDLFEPHGGTHWTAVPEVVFWGLWKAVGATSYRYYQIPVLVTHLALGVLLNAVMGRSRVRPWLRFAAVTLFVLVGPGAVNSVWAFQIGFSGSIAWGLGHLLLADHDGPVDRRDLLGLACGLLAITSSAVGVTLTVGVAVAVMVRRGWRPALFHAGPLILLYAGWMIVADAGTTNGSPPIGLLVGWVQNAAIGAFLGLGYFAPVAWALAVVLAVGLAVGLSRTVRAVPESRVLRSQVAIPLGLLVAAGFFVSTTYVGRWWTGPTGARADRYVYLEAILILPAVALAAEVIARRWVRTAWILVVVLLVPVPFHMTNFDQGIYGEKWMANREYVLRTAVRMPFARDVPRDVRPMSSAIAIDPITIGFLLDAEAGGDLKPSTLRITEAVTDEFKVRLGVARRIEPGLPRDCRLYQEPITLDTGQGDELYLGSGVSVAVLRADGQPSDRKIPFPGSAVEAVQLRIELPDLSLWVGPARGAESFKLCRSPLRP